MHVFKNGFIVLSALSFSLPGFSQGHNGHNVPQNFPNPPSNSDFSTSIMGLPEVAPTAEVRLQDGSSFSLEAKPAKQKIGTQWVRRLAYNGSVPGPIFRVKQGSAINLTLQNSTDIETTIHPHGLRIDYGDDGVPGVSQDPIAIGKSYAYQLKFPDPGIYWYHPHIREDYSQEAGLHGVFIVEPKDPNAYNPVHKEIPLVLDDILLDPNMDFSKHKTDHTLMGRFGNVNLVNGQVNPSIEIIKEEIVRFFVLNASNTRVFAFAIPNTKLKVVGGDNGLYEKEFWADKVILGPGERAIVEAQFNKPGSFAIRNNKPTRPVSIGQILVKDGQAKALDTNFEELRSNDIAISNLKDIRAQLSKPIDKELSLTVEMDHNSLPMDSGVNMGGMNMPGMDHSGMNMGHSSASTDGIEWDDDMGEMNAASDTSNVEWKIVDNATKLSNMKIDWAFTQGQFVKIRIFNDPKSMHPMQHPIHFHGQRFVVSATNGMLAKNLVWKDTVLVPSGAMVDIILEASNPGEWMSHCHISEHLEANMMFGFSVN